MEQAFTALMVVSQPLLVCVALRLPPLHKGTDYGSVLTMYQQICMHGDRSPNIFVEQARTQRARSSYSIYITTMSAES